MKKNPFTDEDSCFDYKTSSSKELKIKISVSEVEYLIVFTACGNWNDDEKEHFMLIDFAPVSQLGFLKRIDSSKEKCNSIFKLADTIIGEIKKIGNEYSFPCGVGFRVDDISETSIHKKSKIFTLFMDRNFPKSTVIEHYGKMWLI